MYPSDIITSFTRISRYIVQDKITWKDNVHYNLNAQITSLSIKVGFIPSSYYNALLVYKITEFYLVLVIPDSDEVDNNSYNTIIEIKTEKLLFNISVISYKTFMNEMKNEGNIKEPSYTLVIFRGFSWSEIVKSLAKENIVVTGGFSSKRHLSSHLSVKHHAYILALFNFDLIGINNSLNFNNVSHDHLFPREDLTRNRRSNVKIKENRHAVVVKDNRELWHYVLNRDSNESSIDNNEKEKSDTYNLDVNNNNTSLNSSKNINTSISNSVQKRDYHTNRMVSKFLYDSAQDKKHIKYYSTTTQYNKKISKNEFDTYLFTQLTDIICNNPINNDTQLLIENFLLYQFKIFISNKDIKVLDINIKNFNSKFNQYCIIKSKELEVYLLKLKNKLNSDKKLFADINTLKINKIRDYYCKLIINNVDFNDIVNNMLYVLFKIITYNDMIIKEDDEDDDIIIPTGITTNAIKVGKYLSNLYIRFLYKEYLKEMEKAKEPSITYYNFKDSFLKKSKNVILVDDEFYVHIGAKILEIMTSCDLLVAKLDKRYNKNLSYYKLTDEVSSLLDRKNSVISVPLNLPMIVKPKPYSKDKFGGYLLNDSEDLIVDKIAYDNKSLIKEDKLYFVVNKLMETPFKINKELLDYLIEYNKDHNLLIDPYYEHDLYKVKSRTKYQNIELQKFTSEKLLQESIIKIASVYSKVPEIYFPLKLDNRGRLYPRTEYFHYQSCELAKALILFAIPETIKRNDHKVVEYLKAYGATCFGNGLNRKSYTKRLEWVNNNWNKIINFKNSDLVSNSDNKFLFLAFCIEMNRFDNFLNNENIHEFKTSLPIQLDGTCNGFQHLALLSNETKLFECLNLFEATKDEDPKDFYENILNQIIVHLVIKYNNSKFKQEKNSLKRLIDLGLSRSNIKSAIMTKPYNAKDKTLEKYIRDTLIISNEEKVLVNKDGVEISETIYWYKIDHNSQNSVNYKDIKLLVKCINDILYINYPKIKLLTEYLNSIAKILNKLNLAIVWKLPNGLMVIQKYLKRKTKKIEPFTYINTSISLTFTDKMKIDKRKQTTALEPNLVHSLDASTLSLLYLSFYNSIEENGIVNFYSVHDCYGVTAKQVENLVSLLKTVYVDIYSNEGYILLFDRDVIYNITSTYNGVYNHDKRVIYIGRRTIELPDISKLINCQDKKNYYDSLLKSIYLIK